MRQVIAAFADEESTLELQPTCGRSMLTVLARLNGRSIGIFANQPKSPLSGSIDTVAADKASRFIELCDAYGFPLVSFIDNPGFMVGPRSEAEGMAPAPRPAAGRVAPPPRATLLGADPQGLRSGAIRDVRMGDKSPCTASEASLADGGIGGACRWKAPPIW